MYKHKLIYLVLLALLAVGLVASLTGYYVTSVDLSNAKAELALQKKDERVLNFLSMFVNRVINADKEIGFEDRLALENTVRSLNDKDILAAWKKFVDSQTSDDAQTNTKNLLVLLINKIYK